MSAPCIAVSDSADFEAGTWTFAPILPGFSVGAGRYAIIREPDFVALDRQRNELLAAMKILVHTSDITDAELESALESDDKDLRDQANAFLVARAAVAKAEAV